MESTILIIDGFMESAKIVDGRKQKVIPFVGVKIEKGFDPVLGFGLMSPDTGEVKFWGSDLFGCLLQSWRAMMFLGKLERIDDRIFSACWCAAAQKKVSFSEQRFRALEEQLGGRSSFQRLRGEILSFVPPAKELEEIIKTLLSEDVRANGLEIWREVKAKRYSLEELGFYTKMLIRDARKTLRDRQK